MKYKESLENWMRVPDKYPNGYAKVKTNGHIQITIFPVDKDGFSFLLDRRSARLLIKRIQWALDEGKRK